MRRLILIIVLLVLIAALSVTDDTLIQCPEDSAIVLLGTGDYVRGEWDEYIPLCIPVDNFIPPALEEVIPRLPHYGPSA